MLITSKCFSVFKKYYRIGLRGPTKSLLDGPLFCFYLVTQPGSNNNVWHDIVVVGVLFVNHSWVGCWFSPLVCPPAPLYPWDCGSVKKTTPIVQTTRRNSNSHTANDDMPMIWTATKSSGPFLISNMLHCISLFQRWMEVIIAVSSNKMIRCLFASVISKRVRWLKGVGVCVVH